MTTNNSPTLDFSRLVMLPEISKGFRNILNSFLFLRKVLHQTYAIYSTEGALSPLIAAHLSLL